MFDSYLITFGGVKRSRHLCGKLRFKKINAAWTFAVSKSGPLVAFFFKVFWINPLLRFFSILKTSWAGGKVIEQSDSNFVCQWWAVQTQGLDCRVWPDGDPVTPSCLAMRSIETCGICAKQLSSRSANIDGSKTHFFLQSPSNVNSDTIFFFYFTSQLIPKPFQEITGKREVVEGVSGLISAKKSGEW